jgi:hypothetical protein
MISLVVLASLFGAVLGKFFKVMVIFPANFLSILLVLTESNYSDDDSLSIFSKVIAVIPSISTCYLIGYTVIHIPYLLVKSENVRTNKEQRGANSVVR